MCVCVCAFSFLIIFSSSTCLCCFFIMLPFLVISIVDIIYSRCRWRATASRWCGRCKTSSATRNAARLRALVLQRTQQRAVCSERQRQRQRQRGRTSRSTTSTCSAAASAAVGGSGGRLHRWQRRAAQPEMVAGVPEQARTRHLAAPSRVHSWVPAEKAAERSSASGRRLRLRGRWRRSSRPSERRRRRRRRTGARGERTCRGPRGGP